MRALGVDIGGTSVRVAVSSEDVVALPVPGSYVELLDLLAGFGSAESVVVGLPGATGPAVPRWIPALSWLDGRPLADDLAARLGGASVVLDNDARLALLAEVRLGAARGLSDAVLVSVGTGIGGAILLGGRIVAGTHGTAGSFGWLPALGMAATPDHGGFELAASGRALDAAAGPGLSGVDVVAGDPAALARWATALGTGIAAIASILDPERVVLSGGLSEAFDAYAEPLRAAVRRAASPDARDVPIVPAALGARAGAIGALCAARGEDS